MRYRICPQITIIVGFCLYLSVVACQHGDLPMGGEVIEEPVTDSEPAAVDTVQKTSSELQIATKDVARAVRRLRSLVRRRSITIADETLKTSGEELSRARFVCQVPLAQFDRFINDLKRLGKVEYSQIRKVTTESFAAQRAAEVEALRRSLERLQALQRQPGLAAEAILALEQQIVTTQTQLAQLQQQASNQRQDIRHATVAVTIVPVYSGPTHISFPTLNVKARTITWEDLGRASMAQHTLLGPGVAYRSADQVLSFSLSVLRGNSEALARQILPMLTLRGFSELLGDGERRFLNPHVDISLGLGIQNSQTNTVVGFGVGVELVKLHWGRLDLTFEALAAAADTAGLGQSAYLEFGMPF